ncbi:ABC transporter substrate-binding protein [Leucobacter sp. BZR 635]
MNRKLVITVAGIATASLALTGCAGGASDGAPDTTLTMVDWGGETQRVAMEQLYQPWAEEHGVTMKEDSPTDYAKLDAMVQAGKVTWGTVEVEPNFSETACADGMLTKLDSAVTQAAEKNGVDPVMMGECGIPILQYSFTIGYNTEKFASGHPTTWAEFFDTEKFPGKRGFWKYATGGIFEAALLADGVAPAALYPLDLDRAFAKLDTIKDSIVWYDTGDQQTQLVASGEAPLVQAWNGRIFKAQANGEPVANEYGEALGTYEQIVIPQGYPNVELAQEWMQWVLATPAAQAEYSKQTGYGPVTPAALDLLSQEEQKELPNSKENQAKMAAMIDYSYWAEHYSEVTEQMNVWMAG